MQIKLLNTGDYPVRLERATLGSSGYDLCLPYPVQLTCKPQVIPLGFALEIPDGWEGQIRPRSSAALKGIAVQFGTIDSDYRGEVGVVAWALPVEYGARNRIQLVRSVYNLPEGAKIAQLVIAPAPQAVGFVEVDMLSETERGSGGFGSTGA